MRSLSFFALLVVLSAGVWLVPHVATGQQVSASYQLFYDELSPYGTWIDYPRYGYVWIPEGYAGFSPYESDGHWIFTEDGWTWVSDYSWGWAPFHYGRWDFDNSYGWFWVPDDEWGPAWVSWRRSPGYFGWAPLRPGISVTMALANDYHERNERWIFVKDRDITRQDIGHYFVNRSSNSTIINNSTMIVNARRDESRGGTYIVGPGRNDVQKATRTTVNVVAIRDNNRPGHRLSNSELYIYKPQVQKRNDNGKVPVPSRLVNLNDMKPSPERIGGNRNPQSGVAPSPNRSQPPQVTVYHSAEKKVRSQQPRAAMPPNTTQPPQPRAVSPSENEGRQQQAPVVNPSEKTRASQPRVAERSNNRGKQPQIVNPPPKSRDLEPQNVVPARESQALPPLGVNPSHNRGVEKQQLKITPAKKIDEPQPKVNQEEKVKSREQN